MSDALARRNVLGAALAAMSAGTLPATAVPLAAPTPADPIFPALDAARAAQCCDRATLTRFRDDDGADAEAACDASAAARDAADAALRATLPTTLPGAVALAEYHAADNADLAGADALAHLVEALTGILADGPQRVGTVRRPLHPPAPDPVFSAIEAVRRTETELSAAMRDLDTSDPVRMRIADEAADRSSDARNALSRTLPTTPAGFRALVRFHAADIAWLEPDTYGALACWDIATAMEGLLSGASRRGASTSR